MQIISEKFKFNSMSVFLLFLLSLFNACEAIIKLPKNVSVPGVIVFGDSLVDQGNNNNLISPAKANYLPYGKDLLIHGKPTGRFCNGKTIPDLLVEELGIKELCPAYRDPNLQSHDLITGVSFASAAAGFDPSTSATWCITLSGQIELFKEYVGRLNTMIGRAKTSYILKNSIYLVVAGSNDFQLNYFLHDSRRKKYSISAYTDLLTSFASKFLQEIYKLGARRIAVVSVPKLGCTPILRTIGGGKERTCFEKVNQAAQLFNQKFKAEIQSLVPQIPQAKVVQIDVNNFLDHVFRNPQRYGFDVVDRGCCTGYFELGITCSQFTAVCPDDSKYFFWDSCHLSESGYKAVMKYVLVKDIYKLF